MRTRVGEHDETPDRSATPAQRRAERSFDPSVDRARNKVVLATIAGICAIMLVVWGFHGMSSLDEPAPADSASFDLEPGGALRGDSDVQGEAAREGEVAEAFDPARSTIPPSFDAQLANALIEKAAFDEDAAFVVEHAADYLRVFGEESQGKLLELAATEPEALPFVRGCLESYPQADGAPLEPDDVDGSIPLLLQWDARWGLVEYSSAPLGLSGCAPTSLSMVYAGLTGRTDRTPADMARLAAERGFMDETRGTYAELFEAVGPELGLVIERIDDDRASLLAALDSGCPVVCNVGAGDFTDGGHFIVIVGQAEDGTLRVNDPYSIANSSVTWDVDRILAQSIGLYAARAAS